MQLKGQYRPLEANYPKSLFFCSRTSGVNSRKYFDWCLSPIDEGKSSIFYQNTSGWTIRFWLNHSECGCVHVQNVFVVKMLKNTRLEPLLQHARRGAHWCSVPGPLPTLWDHLLPNFSFSGCEAWDSPRHLGAGAEQSIVLPPGVRRVVF